MKKLFLVIVFLVGCRSPRIGEPVYKRGDLVYSHCGGPKMMVTYDVYGSDTVYVEWSDHLGHVHRDSCSQTQVSRASNE